MRELKMGFFAIAMGLVATSVIFGHSHQVQAAAQSKASEPSSSTSIPNDFVRWPLATTDRTYATIDGKHLHQYVDELVEISRHYRDQGHPQFWGRIIGTSGDAESAQWLLDKFNKIGLSETRIQPVDLAPQWMPQSWDVAITVGGKTLNLATAQPAYGTPATPQEGLNVEAAYAGLGSEADFAGRDVRGKAVFIFSMPAPGQSAAQTGALKRAEEKGAAAIFTVEGLPGNMKYQSYPTGTNVPTFSLGAKDGQAVRTLIGQAGNEAPHVSIHISVKMMPDLKTALVWGKLPGTTDETIYIVAHRDGWFDAAGDNAGGVASMLGLAEYFAKIPNSQRRRTVVFLGLDGHHNTGVGGGAGREWLVAHRNEFFTKTALMINCEHPSNVEAVPTTSNTYVPQLWYAGGPSRPNLEEIASQAFREFGVTTWTKPNPVAPGGDLVRFYWFLPGVATTSNEFLYFHTDENTPETVPWTGLEAATRAYAKIVDQVNKLDLKDLQRPAESDPRPPHPPVK